MHIERSGSVELRGEVEAGGLWGAGGNGARIVLKWLIGIFAFCVVVCGGGGVFLATSEQGRAVVARLRPKEKLTEVRMERVGLGELVRTVSAPGQIEPRTNVKISAQVSERITALPFREGEEVKAGDVVVRLDSRDLAALLESAQANLKAEQARLEGARARLVQAEADLKRARDLFGSKDVSRSALDAAEAEFLQAQSALRASEQAIEIARANIIRAEKDLDNAVITSPIDGLITTLDAEVGETVVVGTLNNPGSVIMEIADLRQMVLKARVDESNIAPVKKGQRAKVYVNAYRDRTFEGVVELVELKRKLDKDQTGYFEVEIALDLPEGELLRSGLTANCDIEVETIRDVIVVPSQAVMDRRVDELPKEIVDSSPHIDRNKAFTRVVYRLAPEGDAAAAGAPAPAATISPPASGAGRKQPVRYKTVVTPVSVGSSDLTRTVILGGLSEGELIVTGPYKTVMELKHDQTVVEEGTQAKEDEKGTKEKQEG